MALDSDHHDQSGAWSKRSSVAAAPTRRPTRVHTPSPAARALAEKLKTAARLPSAGQPTAYEAEVTPEPDHPSCERPVTPPILPKAHSPQPAMERLATLLESALAAVVTMQDTHPTTPTYPDRITTTLTALVKRVAPPPPDSTRTAVAQPAHAPSAPSPSPTRDTPSPTPITAQHTSVPPTPPPPSPRHPPSRRSSAPRQPRATTDTLHLPDARHASHFTLRFPKHDGPIRLTQTPAALLEQLNLCCKSASSYTPGRGGFAGLRWTSNGNLVIHTYGAFKAQNARDNEKQTIENVVQRSCEPSLRPVLELNDPWFGVVLHGIPAADVLAAMAQSPFRFPNELATTFGIPTSSLKDVRLLCPDGDAHRVGHVSTRVMVTDYSAAVRIINAGANILGHHVRASWYRPRTRSKEV
ncbi:hypothetical protein EV122DRAFT_273386 [Schizophyllum commune]